MSLFRTPGKVYFKSGCLEIALDELKTVYGVKKAFVVANRDLYLGGDISAVGKKLDYMGIQYCCFCDISDSPSLDAVKSGVAAMRLFDPDVVIAAGSSAVIEAAKLMKVQYEHPESDIETLCTSIGDLPPCSKLFAAIPVLLDGLGAVAPTADIASENGEISVTDYQLLPDITVIDPLVIRYSSAKELDSFRNAMTLLAYSLCYSKDSSAYTDSFVFRSLDILVNKLPGEINDDNIDPTVIEMLCEAMGCMGIAYGNTTDLDDVLPEPEFSRKAEELNNALGLSGAGDLKMIFSMITKMDLF